MSSRWLCYASKLWAMPGGIQHQELAHDAVGPAKSILRGIFPAAATAARRHDIVLLHQLAALLVHALDIVSSSDTLWCSQVPAGRIAADRTPQSIESAPSRWARPTARLSAVASSPRRRLSADVADGVERDVGRLRRGCQPRKQRIQQGSRHAWRSAGGQSSDNRDTRAHRHSRDNDPGGRAARLRMPRKLACAGLIAAPGAAAANGVLESEQQAVEIDWDDFGGVDGGAGVRRRRTSASRSPSRSRPRRACRGRPAAPAGRCAAPVPRPRGRTHRAACPGHPSSDSAPTPSGMATTRRCAVPGLSPSAPSIQNAYSRSSCGR